MVAKPEETPQGIVGLTFAKAIMAGNYELAHSMLSGTLRAATTSGQLAEDFHTMISYTDCSPDNVPEVEVMNILDEWPAKRAEDIGWAYVSISNDCYCEAVSVVVTQEQGQSVIRELEWGRP